MKNKIFITYINISKYNIMSFLRRFYSSSSNLTNYPIETLRQNALLQSVLAEIIVGLKRFNTTYQKVEFTHDVNDKGAVWFDITVNNIKFNGHINYDRSNYVFDKTYLPETVIHDNTHSTDDEYHQNKAIEFAKKN